jgi:hypothetical protein
MEVIYKVANPEEISDKDKAMFLCLLRQQGKVTNPTIDRINRCKLLCLCIINDNIISIGAIKPKTNSDFDTNKANLNSFRNDFEFELGYCFTLPEHIGKGYSSTIVKLLVDKSKDINLIASTELRENNSMVRILERNGFRLFGKPWKSTIHGGTLGLFLKFLK